MDTTINASSPMYTIISASKNATTYTAVLVPNGTQSEMFEKFEEDLTNSSFEVGTHEQNTFISDIEEIEEQGFKFKAHMRRIKAESGIYILMVVAQPQNERLPDIETFYNSLKYASK